MTGFGEIREAVEAIKLGAEHYFQKPIDLDELTVVVERNLGIGSSGEKSCCPRKSLSHNREEQADTGTHSSYQSHGRKLIHYRTH